MHLFSYGSFPQLNSLWWKTLVKKTLFNGIDTDRKLCVVILQSCFNFVTGMKDRGVVFATEKLSDLRIGHVQFGTAEKHADLTRHDDLFAAFVGHDVIDRNVISASNDFDNDLSNDFDSQSGDGFDNSFADDLGSGFDDDFADDSSDGG